MLHKYAPFDESIESAFGTVAHADMTLATGCEKLMLMHVASIRADSTWGRLLCVDGSGTSQLSVCECPFALLTALQWQQTVRAAQG